MPPTIPPSPPLSSAPPHTPRVVVYHQTHYHRGTYVSILPLITEASSLIGVTHLIIAAIHLNETPGDITLNDDPPDHPKHAELWEECIIFQDLGVSVLGMLGGAAQGSFRRLDGSDFEFEAFYLPLRDMLRSHKLDGIDLDVEEEMSLAGIIRLIDRLRLDFPRPFLITLAPVATALLGLQHLSGFDYEALEVLRGSSIDWYNAQFYNNWGHICDPAHYSGILARGWRREKVVCLVLTNPGNGNGWVGWGELGRVLGWMRGMVGEGLGGVGGWEYFNSVSGGEGEGRPWEWAEGVRGLLGAID